MKESLTSEDVERCNMMVKNFIKTNDQNDTIVMPDRLMINQCFYYFRSLYHEMSRKKGGAGGPAAIMGADMEASAAKSSANDGGDADPA